MSPGRNPKILIVTPEITSLPKEMGNLAAHLTAKAGGLADVSASLVSALFSLGADVHVALPHYRRLFHIDVGKLYSEELRVYKSVLPDSRIHLAQDRIFYYRDAIYSDYHVESDRVSLAFQREIINNIMPHVNPDLIHCNDWTTGLIPPMARRLGIPCLLTIHNAHTHEMTLAQIEDSGIDAAEFWPYLFYRRVPQSYEESRSTNKIDLLTSGIFASHFVNTVSPTFLDEIIAGYHDFVPDSVRAELRAKKAAGCAVGILNAPDPSYRPDNDALLAARYTAVDHPLGKRANKRSLQERLGLIADESAPLLFWPSRLDPNQKGCQLMADVLYRTVSAYWHLKLQVVFVADGPFQKYFRDIVSFHGMRDRVAVCDFDDDLSHVCYAASDFVLMPSKFEPCGLPQMIAMLYGSLPIVRDTGGLHDTVSHLDVTKGAGNGFVFEHYDANGLQWAIDQALNFYQLPPEVKAGQIARVMMESASEFTHSTTAKRYCDLYEKMLDRPLVSPF